ncbi:DUF6221 family protein [Streptomyces longwoodensis]|uniref:DUF6221 family protein n=1 Tax=Streptomyces longwoodensis TaxID=68231 RepID=UPI0033E42CC1
MVEFLRARLAEDAEVAQDATVGPWSAEHPEGHWGDDPEARLVGGGKILGSLSNDYNGHLNADHIVRHDPARVLAEVEAKRRMIEDTWGGPDYQDMWEHHMRLLALPYAGHPDYREEWRP